VALKCLLQFVRRGFTNRFRFGVRALQLVLRSFECLVRALQLLLRGFAVGLCTLQFFLRPFALALGALKIVVRGLSIRLRSLSIGLRAFEVGLRALNISLCAFSVGVGAFEIRLRASALVRDRFFQFTARLVGRLRGGLFGLAPCAGDRLGQRALDVGACRRHLGLEARPPLHLNLVQLGGPALLGIRVSTLTRIVKRLFVTLRQIPQVSVELRLQFGANAVNHPANVFLGH